MDLVSRYAQALLIAIQLLPSSMMALGKLSVGPADIEGTNPEKEKRSFPRCQLDISPDKELRWRKQGQRVMGVCPKEQRIVEYSTPGPR
jgi:hypothetical protein